MEILEKIIVDKIAPANKNVLWCDTSGDKPCLRKCINGVWKSIWSDDSFKLKYIRAYTDLNDKVTMRVKAIGGKKPYTYILTGGCDLDGAGVDANSDGIFDTVSIDGLSSVIILDSEGIMIIAGYISSEYSYDEYLSLINNGNSGFFIYRRPDAYYEYFADYNKEFAVGIYPSSNGTVSAGETLYANSDGVGYFKKLENETITLTATPNTGYTFVKWQKASISEGSIGSYSDIANATNATYSTTVSEDCVYKAIFAQVFTVNVTSGGNGSVTSSSNTVVAGGSVTLTATADEGYTFSEWSDGNTDNPRTITNIQNNISLSAVFEQLKSNNNI